MPGIVLRETEGLSQWVFMVVASFLWILKNYMRQLKVLSSAMDAGSKDVQADCLQLAAEGKIRPVIGKKLPLKDAAEGHRLVEKKAVIGKVILEP